MTGTLRIALLLMMSVTLVSCASHARVQSNYNDKLRLDQYNTFGFADYEGMDAADLPGDLKLYFSGAIMRELHERGLSKSDTPDLLVNVSVSLEDVTRPPNRIGSCPRYEDYLARKKMLRYGGLHGESQRPVCVYSQGQVVVEIVDVARNEAVMEGVSRVRLDEEDRGMSLQISVASDVATMFGASPVRTDTRPSAFTFD